MTFGMTSAVRPAYDAGIDILFGNADKFPLPWSVSGIRARSAVSQCHDGAK